VSAPTRRTQVARRRTGIAVGIGLLVVLALVLLLPRRTTERTLPSTPGAMSPPAPSDPSPDHPELSEEMPPAWLAWIAGSLPEGLAAAARDEPALGTTVVVAGDTRWMIESRHAEGDVVDRPDPPYRIPIDAFAVSPHAYAPFVPEAWGGAVTHALRTGRAVLGESSASSRRTGTGGVLVFDGAAVRVGPVVPDAVVGYAEMLVSRDVGRRLGIVDERYLLSLPGGSMTEHRFAATMSRLVPGTDVETVAPGGTPYVRIASGVNPPVVTKTIFGEFAAYPQPGNEAFLAIDPAWVEANIRTREIPLLGRVTSHRKLLPPLIAALEEVQDAGLGSLIDVYSGCWAARTVAWSPTAPPSQHAYGAAIDINAPQSPFGTPPNFDPRIVAIFEERGFNWGGDFLIPDGHHFEWWGGAPMPEDA